MDVCLYVLVVDPVVTQLVTLQHRAERITSTTLRSRV
jgi:hypothetical protein